MSRKRLLTKEQPHQARAFEVYYDLGEHRSYERVAQESGVSASTVKLWARSFGWQDRVRERDVAIAREVADRTVTDEVSRRERSVQIVHMALVQLARGIVEGQVKMTLGDLDKLIRLEALTLDDSETRDYTTVVLGLVGDWGAKHYLTDRLPDKAQIQHSPSPKKTWRTSPWFLLLIW